MYLYIVHVPCMLHDMTCVQIHICMRACKYMYSSYECVYEVYIVYVQ